MTLPYEWVLTRLIPILIALGGLGLWHHQQVKRAEQAVHAHYAVVLADISGKTAAAAAEFRATEKKWQTSIEKEAQDGRARINAARRDAGAARGERDRMLVTLDRYRAAARAAAHPGAADAGPAAGDALDLLAELFAGADAAAGELAQAADLAHAAGVTCERSYDALTQPLRGESDVRRYR